MDKKQQLEQLIDELEDKIKEATEELKQIKEQEEYDICKPDMQDRYYYITSNGEILGCFWENAKIDNSRYKIGNCFKTKQDAKNYIEYLETHQQIKNLAINWNKNIKDEEKETVSVLCFRNTEFLSTIYVDSSCCRNPNYIYVYGNNPMPLIKKISEKIENPRLRRYFLYTKQKKENENE